MLSVSRRSGQAITIGHGQKLFMQLDDGRLVELLSPIQIFCDTKKPGRVKLAIDAPPLLQIQRKELLDRPRPAEPVAG